MRTKNIKVMRRMFEEAMPDFKGDPCEDCEKRPKYEIVDISVKSKRKLCNRHFYLFSQDFAKWFLEDIVFSIK